MDYGAITQQLKKLPADRTLSESQALQFVQILKVGILQKSDLAAVLVLTKLLDATPKSDAVFGEFDAPFMHRLSVIVQAPDTPANVTRSTLRIWLTYLAGVIPMTRTRGMFNTLLEEISGANSVTLVQRLVKCITQGDTRMNLNIVDFVAKVLYRMAETINNHAGAPNVFSPEEKWLVKFLRSLYISDCFGTLAGFEGVEEVKKMTGLAGSMEMVSEWAKGKTVTLDSPWWQECVALGSAVGIKLVYPTTPCGLVPVLVMIGVLSSAKKSLLKALVECSLDEPFPLLYFVLRIEASIEMRIVPSFASWNVSLWYALLSVAARSWLFSGAKLSEGDEEVVVKSTVVMLDWFVDQARKCEPETIPPLLDDVANFKYEDLRQLQIDKIREGTMARLGEDRVADFRDMIHDEVVSFVKNERFLELSKGCWVYAQNPLGMGHYTGMWYFVTLSPDAQSIIYKEFPKRLGKSRYAGIASVTTAPNIDQDGVRIDLKSVTSVTSEPLTADRAEGDLITLTSQRMIVSRIDIETPKTKLSFYVNTMQLKEIWNDGLALLVDEGTANGHIADQIAQLENIAIKTQLISLESHEFEESNATIQIPPLPTHCAFHYH